MEVLREGRTRAQYLTIALSSTTWFPTGIQGKSGPFRDLQILGGLGLIDAQSLLLLWFHQVRDSVNGYTRMRSLGSSGRLCCVSVGSRGSRYFKGHGVQ
jgi:hypothetical protein